MRRPVPPPSAALGAALLLAALPGCPPGPGGAPPPAPLPVTAPTPAAAPAPPPAVARACGACHAPPPADVLPRGRWPAVIDQMRGLAAAAGRPLADADVAAARAAYAAAAPEALPLAPQAAAVDARLGLRAEHLTPAGVPRVPAVGGVAVARLSHPERPDLLVAELRVDRAGFFPLWAPPGRQGFVEVGRGLAGPVSVAAADVDGDGRTDLVVAGIGGVNPTDERRGQVTVLRQREARLLVPEVAADALGRPVVARPADLDGDGDVDLVVAAFGWVSAGELVVLEQVPAPAGPGGGRLAWRRRQVDARDGVVEVVPADLDGDGRLDLVAALGQEHEQVVVYRGRGGLAFDPPRVLDQAPHPAWGTSGLEVVDLDRDGDLDVLVANGDTLDDLAPKPWHGVAWLERGPDGAYRRRPIGQVYGGERAVSGDLDGDGDLDVVAAAFLPYLPEAERARLDVDSLVWFERGADGGWTRRALEKGACHHGALAVGDLDGDGALDVVVGNFTWMVEDDAPLRPLDWVTVFTRRR